MVNFDAFLAGLKNDITAFAQRRFKNLKDQAVADGNAFVKGIEADLKNWTSQLAAGKLSRDDFEFLVASKKDSAELEALKLAGLAQARKDQFVNGLIAVVVGAAMKAV